MYGLKHTKSDKIIKFYLVENDKRDFCISKTVYLSLDEEHPVWSVEDRETAEEVRNRPRVSWSNAGHRNPSHNFDPEELEIIKL